MNMSERFELTQETYDIAYPAIKSKEEKYKIEAAPKIRLFFSEEALTLMQVAISTYLEVSDPESEEHKKLESYAYQFEDFKQKVRKKKPRRVSN